MNVTIRPTYDTETVRAILEQASGSPMTAADIYNLCRRGKALHGAQKRRGAFSTHIVRRVAEDFTRRRLATQLGRVSPRFVGPEHSRTCTQCGGIAVQWGGSVLCENGHLEGRNE